jgi:hypothetical protein
LDFEVGTGAGFFVVAAGGFENRSGQQFSVGENVGNKNLTSDLGLRTSDFRCELGERDKILLEVRLKAGIRKFLRSEV